MRSLGMVLYASLTVVSLSDHVSSQLKPPTKDVLLRAGAAATLPRPALPGMDILSLPLPRWLRTSPSRCMMMQAAR